MDAVPAAADGPDGEPEGVFCMALGNEVPLSWFMDVTETLVAFPAADIHRFITELTDKRVSNHDFLPKLSSLKDAIIAYTEVNGPIPALRWNPSFDREPCTSLCSSMSLKIAEDQYLHLRFDHIKKGEYVYDCVMQHSASIKVKTRAITIQGALSTGNLFWEKSKPDETVWAGGKRRKSRRGRGSRSSRRSRRSRQTSRR